jgi:hypothetical protein
MPKNKKDFYRWVKIAGFASFIPFILLSGPIGGYLIGDFFRQRFHLNRNVMLIAMVIGSAASFAETIRIIKMMLKLDKG